MINRELESYDQALAGKPRVVAGNKTDLAEPGRVEEIREAMAERGVGFFPISALTGEGLVELLEALSGLLRESRETGGAGAEPEPSQERTVYRFRPKSGKGFEVIREEDGFRVSGEAVEKLVVRTDLGSHEALAYLQKRLRTMGVEQELEKAGRAGRRRRRHRGHGLRLLPGLRRERLDNMQGDELRERVKLCIGMAAGHPAWWVVAFFTTLVIDRPLQFLFGSLFLTGRSDVFPSIIDLTSGRDSLLSTFIVVSAVLLVVGKALDYWGQSTLIALADGEAAGTGEGMAEALRRGWKALAVYAATVLPVDLARYLLLLLPGFAWLAWRGFDPDFDHWCAYTLIILAWLFTCVPLAVALGVFSELAGREVMLGASRPPAAWRSARELGWGNRARGPRGLAADPRRRPGGRRVHLRTFLRWSLPALRHPDRPGPDRRRLGRHLRRGLHGAVHGR